MKKSFVVITLLAGAVSGYSQGAILFYMYSTAPTLKQAIFNTQSAAGSQNYSFTYGGVNVYETVGSATGPVSENPKGTTVYSGTGLSGTGYDMQLLAGPAGITTVGGTSSANGANNVGLTAVGGISNFRTVTAILGMQATALTVTLPNTSYFQAGDQVSLAVAAWNNEGGTITTLPQAVAADLANPGSAPFGISPVVTTTYSTGLSAIPPSNLPTTLESFSLGFTSASVIPEPGMMALCVMGASTLLFRRRI